MPYLTKVGIDAASGQPLLAQGTPLKRARQAMRDAGCDSPGQ